MEKARELQVIPREVVPEEARRGGGYPRGTYVILYGKLLGGGGVNCPGDRLRRSCLGGTMLLYSKVVSYTAFNWGQDFTGPGT